MKHILTALILLPCSSFAMDQKEEYLAAISLTRDGEGERKVVLLSPNDKEAKATFPMYSRDLKNKAEYTVALSLLKLNQGQATMKGRISKEQIAAEKNSSTTVSFTSITETIGIPNTTIPVNKRHVQTFRYLSDLASRGDQAQEENRVTLGLVILDLPKAKL